MTQHEFWVVASMLAVLVTFGGGWAVGFLRGYRRGRLRGRQIEYDTWTAWVDEQERAEYARQEGDAGLPAYQRRHGAGPG